MRENRESFFPVGRFETLEYKMSYPRTVQGRVGIGGEPEPRHVTYSRTKEDDE